MFKPSNVNVLTILSLYCSFKTKNNANTVLTDPSIARLANTAAKFVSLSSS
jgi:hypothetical protein